MSKQLAIVIPCYNEEDVLPETTKRIVALIERLASAGKISDSSRIYYVDDGSSDATWSLIKEYARSGLPVVGIHLSRNQGHQNALIAGLFSAKGDAIVSIDADLQDDINAIEEMVDHYLDGSDIVYGVRKSRMKDSFLKRFSAKMFYRILSLLGAEAIYNHADYRLLSRRAVAELMHYREINLYLRGIVPLLGFQSSIVYYNRDVRFAGESKYPLKKMLGLALNAVTSFSVVPLRIISFLGVCVFLFAIIMSGYVLWTKLIANNAVPGWSSTLLPIYFIGGIQLLSLGVIGEYLGKVYGEIKARPRYVIEESVGDK